MEIHRLKPVPENYDRELFNSLYEVTRSLRKSLTYQVDARRFGVSPDVIASWFDDKFTYVFFKYYGVYPPEVLKGYIINSLKTFKFRMLRKAYQESYIELYNNIVHLEDQEKELSNIPDETGLGAQEALLDMALTYLKSHLPSEAYTILEITINPPLYIISRMKDPSVRIPTKLILEFLDITPTDDMISKVNKIRRNIDEVIASAKYHFREVNLEVA
jgi:hypothetical protein